jgi:aryl-alcohol dehydrogenase-like predicted oxidoreductase
MRALSRALERGINTVHSSYEYGTMWAVGRVLEKHPACQDIHHVVKVPLPDFKDRGRFREQKFRRIVHAALRQLRAERIEVVQHLHRATPNTDDKRLPALPDVLEGLFEAFEKLHNEGLVGSLALFPYTTAYADLALQYEHVRAVVGYHNLIELPWAGHLHSLHETGRGFLGIRPFMTGLLTDKRIHPELLRPDDRFRDPRWRPAYERLRLLRSALGDSPSSMTELAVKFCLSSPAVTTVIAGLNTPEQVDEAVEAAGGEALPSTVVKDALSVLIHEGVVHPGPVGSRRDGSTALKPLRKAVAVSRKLARRHLGPRRAN